jgi:REP element-mobilizing transposase RayT
MEKVFHHSQFMTATIMGWKRLLTHNKYKYKIIVLQKLKQLVDEKKIILYAYCVMDNHIHLIWQINKDINPTDMRKYFLESTAKFFKDDLSIHHLNVLKLFASTQKDRIYHFWKRRPLSIDLFTTEFFLQKLDYIHNNPVKAGLCAFPEQYEFSSANFYMNGIAPWNILTHFYS